MSDLGDITQLGTILGIWAHPDDESFMVGGLLSIAASNGQKVICITATKGEGGVRDESRWPAATLAETRSSELAAALEILGINEHQWLGYADGKCAEASDEEVVPSLVELIEKYQPDTIITFPPDGLTGHPDHQAVSRWARKAAAATTRKPELYFAVHTQETYDSFLNVLDDKFNIYFAVDRPILVPQAECDLYLALTPEVATRKAAALKAMPSQYETMFEFLGDKGMEFALGTEALVHGNSDSRWAGL